MIYNDMLYSGVMDTCLCAMAEVSEVHCQQLVDSFPNRDILAIRIADETIQSNLTVVGVNFLCKQTRTGMQGE